MPDPPAPPDPASARPTAAQAARPPAILEHDPREIAAVFTGGMAGALARVWVARELTLAPHGFPVSTLLINLAGAALLGMTLARPAGRPAPWRYRRSIVATGFCGAFTTFSTMQVELVQLLRDGRAGTALLYAAASLAGGLAAAWAAGALTHRMRALA